ncbi:uncharacterized protein C8orf74 homolog [Poeciliopsis prolifica]|uniref:uncharacterized protein C8orf74 homolog n=1 Tax=Poeciliopsis prolifica TaxID=188132 RepID=UPI00241463D7|nr:uncharacterized protein C8orf74 homolog [Poeciliopsis prolifica]
MGFRLTSDDLLTSSRQQRNFRVRLPWQPSDLEPVGMDSLTETEMAKIARLPRSDGIQRLSRHFNWFEFTNEKLPLHQEFVYDVAMFTAGIGFSWANVILSARLAKVIFLQLHEFDLNNFWPLLRDVLCEHFPYLTSLHQHDFTQFLIDTCVCRRRLFQAVVGLTAEELFVRKQLEVQLPPIPCPLAQGTDLEMWEAQSELRAKLESSLKQLEEKLKCVQAEPRVTLEDFDVPSDGELDKESAVGLVRSAVKATGGQVLASLSQETSLRKEIFQIKMQQEALITAGRPKIPSPVLKSPKAKGEKEKTKTKAGKKK